MDNEKTLVICDTEPVSVEGVRALLEGHSGMQLVAAETTLAEGMEAVSLLCPSAVLIDRAFGAQRITDWLRKLDGAAAATRAIVWGSAMSDSEGMRFLQAGAAGVLRKSAPLAAVRECIRTVASGGMWMEDGPAQAAAVRGRRSRTALTAREAQVMDLVERGLKNKEIAGALGISMGTVKIHLKHIFEKTGIRGRYGLALSGLKEKGLLAVAVEQVV